MRPSSSRPTVSAPVQKPDTVQQDPSDAFSDTFPNLPSDDVDGLSSVSSSQRPCPLLLSQEVASRMSDDDDEAVWIASSEKPRRHSCPPMPEASIGDTPRTLPARGGGARNPSPWEPTFSIDGDDVEVIHPSKGIHTPLRYCLGKTDGLGTPQKHKPSSSFAEPALSSRGPRPKMAAVDFSDQENAPPVVNVPIHGKEKTPSRKSLPAKLPAAPAGATLLASPSPGVAEDPEVKPLPVSTQPSLLGSCSGTQRSPLVESVTVQDSGWCQPRHCLRHYSAMGSPGEKLAKKIAQAAKQGTGQRHATHPWLCCGFTTPVCEAYI
jgi:hypothetical protein